MALAAEVKAVLVLVKCDIEVMAQNGIVYIHMRAAEYQEAALISDLEGMAQGIAGVREVNSRRAPVYPIAIKRGQSGQGFEEYTRIKFKSIKALRFHE